jgi:ankyrin repeat protein
MPSDGWNLSPLMTAVVTGDLEAVERLLAGGADPNDAAVVPKGGDLYAMPALVCAVWLGHTSIARALLARGANANASHRFGREDDDAPLRYALGLAIDRRDLELVAMLLDAGATLAYEPPPWFGEPIDGLTYAIERAYDGSAVEGPSIEARIVELLRSASRGSDTTET